MARRSLSDISRSLSDGGNPSTKPPGGTLYQLYDRYFAELADQPVTLLELGVHAGESLKIFGTYFANGKIIGLDIADRGTDFSAWPNIVFAAGDQTDAALLARLCAESAPLGLDIVIDDASHLRRASLASYRALFPFVKPGGFYIVEDWTTGYWDDWPNGGRFVPVIVEGSRVPSHDYGMVGFVKSLVDEVASDRIRPSRLAEPTRERRLDFMQVHPEMVVLRKTGG